jgi:hypothetical protein
LEKKHIRVFMVLEYASVGPYVLVEIEKCLTAIGQIEVKFTQIPAAQKFLEFLTRIPRVKHRSNPPWRT